MSRGQFRGGLGPVAACQGPREWLDIVRREWPRPLAQLQYNRLAITERRPVHIADLGAEYVSPLARGLAHAGGYRSLLWIPMLKSDSVIGLIGIGGARPFSDDHIELLKTFADQAVIAVENARLLTELRARTAELTRSVDELTALGDVSRALSSALDLETVLQTIVTRANQIAATAGCTIWARSARTSGRSSRSC